MLGKRGGHAHSLSSRWGQEGRGRPWRKVDISLREKEGSPVPSLQGEEECRPRGSRVPLLAQKKSRKRAGSTLSSFSIKKFCVQHAMSHVLIGQENQSGLETLTSQSGRVPTEGKDAVICHIQHCVRGIPQVMTGILAVCLERWRACARTPWVLRSIQWGYRLQFLVHPPCFSGVITTSVSERDSPVLRDKIRILLCKGAIQVVPQESTEEGFYRGVISSSQRKAGDYVLSWICGSWTSTSDVSSSRCLRYVIFCAHCVPGIGLHQWTWLMHISISQSARGTENFGGSPSRRLHKSFKSCRSAYP